MNIISLKHNILIIAYHIMHYLVCYVFLYAVLMLILLVDFQQELFPVFDSFFALISIPEIKLFQEILYPHS